MQRLDQINAFKHANLIDFESLALKIRTKQIGLFKTVIRPELGPTRPPSRLLAAMGRGHILLELFHVNMILDRLSIH